MVKRYRAVCRVIDSELVADMVETPTDGYVLTADYDECESLRRTAMVNLHEQLEAAEARLAEAEADQRRFIWWMTVRDTGGRFLLSYRRGVAEGWSMDQWRTAIDEAMSATDSATVCPQCNGRKKFEVAGREIWCPICNGTGSTVTPDSAPAVHQHTDECWEPNSGCDMGRNEAYVAVVSASHGPVNEHGRDSAAVTVADGHE